MGKELLGLFSFLLLSGCHPMRSFVYFTPPAGEAHLSAHLPVYNPQGKLAESKFTNTKGELITWFQYDYTAEGHVLKSQLSPGAEDYGQVIAKEEWLALDRENGRTENSRLVKRWIFTSRAPYKVTSIEHYDLNNQNRITQKDVPDDQGKVVSEIHFTYGQDSDAEPTGFIETDLKGQVIADYQKQEPYDLVKALRKELQNKTPLSEAAIQEWKALRENPQKFLIAIIDSGFDYNHPDLVTKWWNNPADPLDGIDNDGNGWIDDNFGWDQVTNQGLPSESISLLKDFRPLSHGTHVAAIATRGLYNVGLIGFSGDYTQASYIKKISAFIKTHQVKIVNMSLGLPQDNKDLLGLRDAIRAYKEMIAENSNTLFVVASGNNGGDIDQKDLRQYPASINAPNVLKIGALEASDFSKLTAQNAKAASFSNYGLKSVDILAPGRNVVAASLGGGQISHSGTSMATPWAVNHLAQLWSELPALTAAQIKTLVIETATVMTPRPQITSGGFLNLRSALLKGKTQFLQSLQALENGPNCWNSATYLANVSEGIHHTGEEEMAFLFASPLCKEVSKEQAQPGDIVAFRRYDKNNKLLPASFLSEIHAYTFLDSTLGFTKNGMQMAAAYQTQSHDEIYKDYRAKEFQNCKILNLERKNCQMKEKIYRCQNIESTARFTPSERTILEQLRLIEQRRSLTAFDFVKISDEDRKAEVILLSTLEARLDGLPSTLASRYLKHRLASISAKF